MMSEGDVNSFERSISKIDSFGKQSGLFIYYGKTQAILWLGNKIRSNLTMGGANNRERQSERDKLRESVSERESEIGERDR